ncbi:MAG: NAD(P)H-hydrate dehydratase [Clostridia bacterium]|nr:NAD(P)H-hydrate dehydratase [Clostridia bacterium]
MQTVVDVKTMRESDAAAIRGGVPSRDLMYRAGVGVFQSYPWHGKTAIVCGSGNNAGDGYVLALLLHQAAIPCAILLLEERFSEDGLFYYTECKKCGIEILTCNEDTDFSSYAEIVDCLLGTGFRGVLSPRYAAVVARINQSGRPVIAVDINSGLNGDSGRAELCVRSSLTVSVGTYKSGHFLGDAKDMIGSLCNVDIGIPIRGKERFLLEAEDLLSVFAERKQNSHKGSYGYVSILGGCREYAGAVKLANLSASALRAGCGVVKLILPAFLEASVSPYLLESTLALLPDKEGHALFSPDALDRVLSGQKALAVGMGWGRSEENRKILQYVLQKFAFPVVIDADGLNTLAEMEPSILRKTSCRVILTPHPKEMERLCGIPVEQILDDPIRYAEEFAREYGVILLLKGPCTVVTNGEKTYLVSRGCAGMATAGSGDVLSGVLAGLLGYAEASPLTVAAGAYLAGRAGELAEQESNAFSMTAGDTVKQLPRALSEILSAKNE